MAGHVLGREGVKQEVAEGCHLPEGRSHNLQTATRCPGIGGYEAVVNSSSLHLKLNVLGLNHAHAPTMEEGRMREEAISTKDRGRYF